jgi:Protein of unknown function (DUF3619)
VKYQNEQLTEIQADQFGRNSIALLSEGAQVLPAKIKERLYAARMKALSVRKVEKVLVQKPVLAGFTGNWSFGSHGRWESFGWIAPLVVLVFGLIAIAQWQNDSRINDIAEVDAALLSDDVPPDAYADSGFLAFLKNGPLSDSGDSADLVQSK